MVFDGEGSFGSLLNLSFDYLPCDRIKEGLHLIYLLLMRGGGMRDERVGGIIDHKNKI